MKASFKNALVADLIASVIGTVAWWSGTANVIWPAHPMVAVLAITIVTDMLLRYVWPLKLSKT